jgi:hypothetical protein
MRRPARFWLDDVRRAVSYAARGLARNTGFATAAMVTLALGIGATTAVFSVVNAVLLRPLPYTDGDRLVRITLMPTAAGSARLTGALVSANTIFALTFGAGTLRVASYI